MSAKLDVSPSFASDNKANIGLFDPVLFRELTLVDTAGSVTAANFQNVSFCQLGGFVSLPMHINTGDWPADMFPFLARKDAGDSSTGDAKLSPQFFVGDIAGSVKVSNLQHLIAGQLCLAMCNAFLFGLAILAIAIRAVFSLSAKKQVGWIATQWGIAVMAAKHTFWYRAVGQFVGNAVRRVHLAVIALEFAVAFDDRGLPQPTVIGAKNIYMRPEALCKGDTARGMILHSNVSFSDLLTPRDGSTHRRGNYLRASIIPQEYAL